MRLYRSYLFAPGNNEVLLEKVFEAGADAVVLDLEDAVPESEKGRARSCVAGVIERQAAKAPSSGGASVFIRINGLQSACWQADIESVVGHGITGLRVPKVESLESLCRLNDALSKREDALGLSRDSVGVVATIETARGVARLESFAAGPRLCGFTFGEADLCADLGADPIDPTASLFARSRLVLTSRERRLAPPVASVFTRLDDDDGLRVDTERQRRLGFFGRSAIHPRQVPIIHAAFAPTVVEVASARKAVAAYESAGREGRGAARSEGGFVDLAVVRRARATIELHERVEGERR